MWSGQCFVRFRRIPVVLSLFVFIRVGSGQCLGGEPATFVRWSGVSAVDAAPVFVYTASGEEDSLTGACLARCRELEDCDAVVVAQAQGECHGVGRHGLELRQDSDVTYFKKACLQVSGGCSEQWWAVESTPGYSLHSDAQRLVANATLSECYEAVLAPHQPAYRSAQWVGPDGLSELSAMTSPGVPGSCLLNVEDKFSEPESYRVANYYTVYLENQCRHDYPKKIDRCSYEEYNNQTLRHVDFTLRNYTKDECKTACEVEQHFVCRGFSWTERRGRDGSAGGIRGLCDLHSEDLVTAGSWLLRRNAAAVYYRRVSCLNITVECEGSDMTVTYRPHGVFRGRVYVPGRGERCSARAAGRAVRLTLPLHGDCDVHFAYAITNTPAGVTNRTMAYVMVMIQNNPIIQTAGDRWVRVGCSPGARASTHSVDATLAVRDTGKPTSASEVAPAFPAAASAVYSANSAPLTMYVVRARDDAAAATSAVSLGEPLELRIETTGEAEIEAYHLVASSRLGDSSVLLLDSRGCPTGQVDFPAFARSWLGGTQRLAARFKAFRFPTSHVVRFALMVRFCENKICRPVNCGSQQNRITREANGTYGLDGVEAAVSQDSGWDVPARGGVVAQGGAGGGAGCGAADGRVPLELEVLVGARDILSADTLVRADHRAAEPEQQAPDAALMCVHELLLVALALAWLAVQVLLLLGCCVLVKRYRNLAEMSLQKDYQSFDNVGFDNVSTHRRVHWPDQNIDILHTT